MRALRDAELCGDEAANGAVEVEEVCASAAGEPATSSAGFLFEKRGWVDGLAAGVAASEGDCLEFVLGGFTGAGEVCLEGFGGFGEGAAKEAKGCRDPYCPLGHHLGEDVLLRLRARCWRGRW